MTVLAAAGTTLAAATSKPPDVPQVTPDTTAPGVESLQHLVDALAAYALIAALAAIIIGGISWALGERLGMRRLYLLSLLGFSVFSAASLGAGLATTRIGLGAVPNGVARPADPRMPLPKEIIERGITHPHEPLGFRLLSLAFQAIAKTGHHAGDEGEALCASAR